MNKFRDLDLFVRHGYKKPDYLWMAQKYEVELVADWLVDMFADPLIKVGLRAR